MHACEGSIPTLLCKSMHSQSLFPQRLLLYVYAGASFSCNSLFDFSWTVVVAVVIVMYVVGTGSQSVYCDTVHYNILHTKIIYSCGWQPLSSSTLYVQQQ